MYTKVHQLYTKILAKMAGMKSNNSKMKVPYLRVPSFFMLFSVIPFANF